MEEKDIDKMLEKTEKQNNDNGEIEVDESDFVDETNGLREVVNL